VAVTSDGGGTWTTTPELNTDGGQGVACAASTTCDALTSGFSVYYTGVVLATTDSGAHWATQPVPSGITSLTGIACPATCFATGSGENNVGAVILSHS
jgi:photosystem II stability/assembly factor-like uncharacterized protein